MRVLIIEDDRRLARLLARVLEAEHIKTDVAHHGDDGLDLVLRGTYDVAIVDWMLPGRDGPAVCRAIRAARVPIALLMLTARTQVEDRVAGLDSGADDYLVKPFAFEEVLARLRALGRRFAPSSADPWELRAGDLVLDLRARTVRRSDHVVSLTATEWDLLEFLMRNPGQTLSRRQILDYVWAHDDEVQATIVDVYVSYVRRKLRRPGEPDCIATVRGVGYRLRVDDV